MTGLTAGTAGATYWPQVPQRLNRMLTCLPSLTILSLYTGGAYSLTQGPARSEFHKMTLAVGYTITQLCCQKQLTNRGKTAVFQSR